MKQRKYRKYGRVWEVLNNTKGIFYIGAKRKGYQDAVLDRLGTSTERADMQAALDRWSKRNGAVEVIAKGEMKQGLLI